MPHVADKSKIPEVLQSLPWKEMVENDWELFGELDHGDSVLFAISPMRDDDPKYDIFAATISIDAESDDSPYSRMNAIENANSTPIDFDITDCDWYCKL